jgi:type IV pilus assembly protein PilC
VAITPSKGVVEMPSIEKQCAQLSSLVKAGLSLHQSLRVLAEEDPHHITPILTHMENGGSLMEALQRLSPYPLPLLNLNTIPNLTDFLDHLSLYLTTKKQQQEALSKQLRYPLFLGSLTVLMMGIIILWMLPVYAQFYSNIGLPIPAFIQFSVCFQEVILKWGGEIILILGLITASCIYRFKQILLSHWNKIWHPFSEADMLWMIGLLIQNGFSLKQALECIHLPKHHPFYTAYLQFSQECQHSGAFSKPFSYFFSCKPSNTALLNHSEKSGQFAETLLLVSQHIHNENDENTTRVIALIQPILLAFLTGVIGWCVYLTLVPTLQSVRLLG